MASPKPKAPQKQARKSGILGVHPLLAAVAVMALVFAGVVFGAWLNVTRTDKPAVAKVAVQATPKPKKMPRPVIPNLDQVESEPPPPYGPQLPDNYEAPRAASSPSVTATAAKRDPNASPLMAYAVSSAAPKTTPIIAIVIDDMGLDRTRGQLALDLPAPLTLSFLTYADNLPSWVARAREAGHEVMAHVPMEPMDPRENPGPRALMMALTPAEVDTRLASLLDNWSGYIGINNHMGSRFTSDKERMKVVMMALKYRGLLWLDSKTTGTSVGADLARASGVPSLERDVFLDNIQSEKEIAQELHTAEQVALQRGTAIAIGHPHEITIAMLREWMLTLPAKGIALAPLSEVARRQGQFKTEIVTGARP